MIGIKYLKSASGYENCFTFSYSHKDYIPEEYEQYDNGAELRFFIDLLQKNGMLADTGSVSMIWNRSYSCIYGDIPFTMVYDEDDDIVSFAVEPENIPHINDIAERIKELIINLSKIPLI